MFRGKRNTQLDQTVQHTFARTAAKHRIPAFIRTVMLWLKPI